MRAYSTLHYVYTVNLLSSMDTLDISTIPVSIEQYTAELPTLAHKQLEQISNPRILKMINKNLWAYIAS